MTAIYDDSDGRILSMELLELIGDRLDEASQYILSLYPADTGTEFEGSTFSNHDHTLIEGERQLGFAGSNARATLGP